MCFTIHDDYPNPLKAKENIICYKAFLKHNSEAGYFLSSFRHFWYEKGECYYENTMISQAKKWGEHGVLEVGLHSYSTKEMLLRHTDFYSEDLGVICTIPQDSTYYYNPSSEQYISDYLIIGKNKDIIL